MPLPTEVLTVVADIVKRRPDNDIAAIVSEVIETMGGKDPNKIAALIKACGGPREFVHAVLEEARRLKSIGHGKPKG
jgi:hypothetical protein